MQLSLYHETSGRQRMEAFSGGDEGPERAVAPQMEWKVCTVLAVWLCTMGGKEGMRKCYTATEI